MTYILYNPIAGGGSGKEKAEEVSRKIQPEMSRLLDVTTLDLHAFFEEIPCTEAIVLAGGDGTINRFINRLHGVVPAHQIYYYPAGSGNDFWNDVKSKTVDGFILLNRYLEKLPIVEVNGEKHFFVNGVGYGIDGYCCEVGDRMRDEGKKNINYASIAIKGLLGRCKTSSATITGDGIAHCFSPVWLAPTMNGRYYGGGMDIAPHQDRLNAERQVSAVVLHCPSKLKTLIVFPSIFKGEHVCHKKMISVYTGSEISVRFDRPAALQIDGETIPMVQEYRVYTQSAGEKRIAV